MLLPIHVKVALMGVLLALEGQLVSALPVLMFLGLFTISK